MAAYVYVLMTRNPGGRIITYVGWTLDLDRRLAEADPAAGASWEDVKARLREPS